MMENKIKAITWSIIALVAIMLATVAGTFLVTTYGISVTYASNYASLQGSGWSHLVTAPEVLESEFFWTNVGILFAGSTLMLPALVFIFKKINQIKNFMSHLKVADMLSNAVNLDKTGMLMVDPKTGRIEFANSSFIDKFGYGNHHDVVRRQLNEIIEIKSFSNLSEYLIRFHPEGKMGDQYKVRMGNGEWKTTRMNVMPVYGDNDKPSHIQFFVQCPNNLLELSEYQTYVVEKDSEDSKILGVL